jgi:hypothetical protein
MLYEYAVEPQAMGSSWQTFRYVIEKFGFDKGRLIAEYPRRWFREVYDAAGGLSPMQKKRVEEALAQARKNKVVRSRRPYDREAGDWLHNALVENRRCPFRAIIALTNPTGDDFVLQADELDEIHPLMAIPQSCVVARDAVSIGAAVKELLQYSARILFVDPYFDPYSPRYKSTLRECLDIVKERNKGADCEIHYRYHDNKPSPVDLEREAENLFRGVIPEGLSVKIFCWREKYGGADFHARYLLSEKGGIDVDAGFSAEGNHQTTDMHLMGFEFCLEKLAVFARDAEDYELVEPVLLVGADGSASHA